MFDSASLDEWLAYLEQLHPTEIEMGLDRIRQVYDRLVQGKLAKQVIVVAGTNGKGTSCALLASYAKQLGLSCGLYSSPHLIDFNERVQVDQIPVSDESLVQAFKAVEQARENISLTYFEFTTLAAFKVFKDQNLDVAVLEIGLGGRLDAVNVVDSDVSVVTSIALDHESWLGNDLNRIALEKAGVYRSGKPAISADASAPENLQKYAESISADFYKAGCHYSFQLTGESKWAWAEKGGEGLILEGLVEPDFPLSNAAAVLCAIQCLDWSIDAKTFNSALSGMSIRGRLEKFSFQGVKGLMDVAHNPHAAKFLARKLESLSLTDKPMVILGSMADKDIDGVVEVLKNRFSGWLCIDLDVPRAISGKALQKKVESHGESALAFNQFSDAWQYLKAHSNRLMDDQPAVFIIGSFFTVAAAIEFFNTDR
jgi:dihydrofolate synthase/folylpolyglutamate synthase